MGRNITAELRERVPGEIFDYQLLMGVLGDYANPRNRVTALLREGDIVRVKKGLYIFGERYRRRLVSRELLANLIYGPSYVSCESALSFHGLIPEGVEAVISMTLKRSKEFDTPLGRFEYLHLNERRYPVGIDRHTIEEQSFLIASPEKAVADLVARQTDLEEVHDYLYESLRLDEGWLKSGSRLQRIAKAYANPRVNRLMELG